MLVDKKSPFSATREDGSVNLKSKSPLAIIEKCMFAIHAKLAVGAL